MYKIFRKTSRNDSGFTLIELLVVMIIIGILAAIAIPVFLHQRQKAVDAAVKSDLHSAAVEMESYYTDHQSYPAAITDLTDLKLSPNDTVDFVSAPTSSYCLMGSNPDASSAWYYSSDAGGLLPKGVTCS